ncbi:IPP transferase [Lignipirellula cremea]|uniref:tRNA dimethylallyltransferase n=2 Tax=Lignipirellula cremea TaxID=2528010 RepID=A0A518DNX3_9BACT|nr:IPP transferase [Lignipirellula cremea]
MALAGVLNAEILSLDSMAVYRGMDIGTAKPTPKQRQAVPHHLLDLVEPTEEYSVSQYVDDATIAMQQIRERGRTPLFVGGTPLYLKSLLRGIFEGPPADWEFREQVEQEVQQVGLQALHQRLMQVDPLSAEKLHPNDKRRIVRALEVYKLTGSPISHLQLQFDQGLPAARCRVFVLQWARPVLHQRIDRRVEAMFAAGLCDEAAALLEKHSELSRTAAQAVGYQEAFDHLRGETSLTDAIETVKARTRQFARRQETWFRSLSECRILTLEEEVNPQELAQQIAAAGAAI